MTKKEMKLVAEIAKMMIKFHLTEEEMKKIIEIHDGDARKALITLKTMERFNLKILELQNK